MTIPNARKALREALKARKHIGAAGRIAAPANGDTVMLEALRGAYREIDRAIARLCRIVPNAELLYMNGRTAPPTHVYDGRKEFNLHDGKLAACGKDEE